MANIINLPTYEQVESVNNNVNRLDLSRYTPINTAANFTPDKLNTEILVFEVQGKGYIEQALFVPGMNNNTNVRIEVEVDGNHIFTGVNQTNSQGVGLVLGESLLISDNSSTPSVFSVDDWLYVRGGNRRTLPKTAVYNSNSQILNSRLFFNQSFKVKAVVTTAIPTTTTGYKVNIVGGVE